MRCKSFNDYLALVLIILIPVMWLLAGRGIVDLPGEIIGATIATWTLIVQHYYRKAKPE